MRAPFLPLLFVSLLSGCAQPAEQAPEEKSKAREVTDRPASFFCREPRAGFTMRIPSGLRTGERIELPASLRSNDPDLPISLDVEIRVPSEKEARKFIAEEKGDIVIGSWLAGKFSRTAKPKFSTVTFDTAVTGTNYRLRFTVSSSVLKGEELEAELRKMFDSFDAARRLGGTL
ncbi:MAG: hypothetical protein U0R49_04985 [Fimbriimonadales bacterium]